MKFPKNNISYCRNELGVGLFGKTMIYILFLKEMVAHHDHKTRIRKWPFIKLSESIEFPKNNISYCWNEHSGGPIW